MLGQDANKRRVRIVSSPENKVSLRRSESGLLLFKKAGEEEISVSVQLCFPWSGADRFLSLKNSDLKEVHLVSNLMDLDHDSRDALLKTMLEEQFVFEVIDVYDVREEFELRVWNVRTTFGDRDFQTPLNSWPRELGSGSLLVKDVNGDVYLIRDLKALSKKAQEKVWAFLDE